jgi:hypothetical protein
MSSTSRHEAQPIESVLERELGLVRDAIAMVASGATARVVLGGLRFGDQLIEPARRLAADSGALVVPLWTTDEGGVDIAIERDGDG